MMFTFLVILLLIFALLFIVVVTFLQSSQKEGGATPLGTAGASQLMGVQKTTDILEKFTWFLVIMMCFLAITATLYLKHNQQGEVALISPNIAKLAKEQADLPAADKAPTEEVAATVQEGQAPPAQATDEELAK